MQLVSQNLTEIATIARSIGWGAADILLEQSRSGFEMEQTGSSPVTSADIAANHYILEHLHAAFGTEDYAYLSEETHQSQPPEQRLNRPWVWIIDPLDGTKDFITRTGEFAVHIALAYQGRPVVSVVACPEMGKLFYATKGGGTFVEQRGQEPQAVRVSDKTADFTIVASRSHRDVRFNKLMERFPVKDQRQIGSVGCKIAAIVDQKADIYFSLSGKSAPKDWDFAAPELILTEAGGQFSYFDGTPLQYNREDVNQWGGIIATNGTKHDELRAKANEILNEIDQES